MNTRRPSQFFGNSKVLRYEPTGLRCAKAVQSRRRGGGRALAAKMVGSGGRRSDNGTGGGEISRTDKICREVRKKELKRWQPKINCSSVSTVTTSPARPTRWRSSRTFGA